MKWFLRGLTLALGVTCAGSAGAQVAPAAPESLAVGDWKLAPVFDMRTRAEFRHDIDAIDRTMLLERVRLGFDAQVDVLETRVVLQDARALAFAPDAFVAGPPAIASTGAYEGWVQVSSGNARPSFVRLGRQPVAWGEGRLLGIADFSPSGRSLDALRARWVVADAAVEVLATALETSSAQGSPSLDAYGELFGARGQWSLNPLLAFEAYVLARIVQEDPANPADSLRGSVQGETYTGALRVHGESSSWTWGAEGAYQIGYASAYAAPRAAWAAAGHVEHRFERALLRPALRLGASYASGDTGGRHYRAFDPLLPDLHTWHGAMDLFTWSNEGEASARVSIVPWIEGGAALEYRYARLAAPSGAWRSGYLVTVGTAPQNSSADLGHEIDAVVTWSPWSPLDLVVGYSALIMGEGAKAILAASRAGALTDVSHMAYGQARVGF